MSAFDPKRTLRHHAETLDGEAARLCPGTLSNSLCAARLTNCRSILLEPTANFLRRNCAIVGPNRMRIDQPR